MNTLRAGERTPHLDEVRPLVQLVSPFAPHIAEELWSVLGETLGTPTVAVLVDLSDCEFIDSTGLSLLVEAKRRLSEERRRFGVCCPDADVRRLLELTGIDEAVGLFDTRDQAVTALRNGAPS